MSQANDTATCQHVHCGCSAPDADHPYCSAYCANAEHEDVQVEESVELAACSCGHDQCRQVRREATEDDPPSGIALGGGPGSLLPPDSE